MTLRRSLFSCLITAVMLAAACSGDRNWDSYGGNPGNDHYSSLRQVDTANVARLSPAWIYRSGGADSAGKSQIQCNPLVIDGTLYGVSPRLSLFALNASTGLRTWEFDFRQHFPGTEFNAGLSNCRGLSFWHEGGSARIFFMAGGFLYSVNAATGRADTSFGHHGRVDLHEGLDRDAAGLFVAGTSPGIVWKDLIVVGDRVSEGSDAAPGHIRAFDVRTGKRRWIFHTIPHPGEWGYESWTDSSAYRHFGGANAWSGFTLDRETGIVYAGLGSVSPDFYGGGRLGSNLFANSVIALDASTGRRVWHYQTVHHDLWDRDLPCPPVLMNVRRNGARVRAVTQITKTGFVFVLDAATGKPLFDVHEVIVPHDSSLPGEAPWPTQPIPSRPAPFVRQSGLFRPPALSASVLFPGFDGGGEWGGPAADPANGILYVNASEMPWTLQMVPSPSRPPQDPSWSEAGRYLFTTHCMSCHGPKGGGTGAAPSLVNIGTRYSASQFYSLLASGRRMMPAFGKLSEPERQALAAFVLKLKKEGAYPAKLGTGSDVPFTMTGYNKLLTKEKLPAVSPPWGTLSAIDLNSGDYLWKVPFGSYPKAGPAYAASGSENYGGGVVTAGGLFFIAATPDAKLHAYNRRTGRLLWTAALPAAGFATPAVYSVHGREFIVIACGGGKLGAASGDAYVAFALPEQN